MDRAKQSAFLPSLAGRVGGLVVRPSSGGSVVSSAPVVSRSVSRLQSYQRDFLAQASRAWATLSADQRRAWGYVALSGEAATLNVVPSLQAGLPCFLRWYQAFLWCGATPSSLSPDLRAFDSATVITPVWNFFPGVNRLLLKQGNPTPVGVAVWCAHCNAQGAAVSRPTWQLICATGLGDVAPWVWNVAPYVGFWSLNLSSFLNSRLWCPTRPYYLMVKLRTTFSGGTAVIRNTTSAQIN